MTKLNMRRALKKKALRKNYEKRRNNNRNNKGTIKLITPPSKKNRYKDISLMNYEEEAILRRLWGFKIDNHIYEK